MLVACIVSCLHPEDTRVMADIVSAGLSLRITWCGFCGAMATDAGEGPLWQPAAAASCLARSRFEELSRLLHALVEGKGIADITALRLGRELAQLDAAIARMPPDA
jgi:hypothetical protein